jgi:hypothetical protein
MGDRRMSAPQFNKRDSSQKSPMTSKKKKVKILVKSVKKAIEKSESPERNKTTKKPKNNLLKGFLTKIY